MKLVDKVIDWVDVRVGVREIAKKQLTGYLVPKNINVWYSLGSVLMFIFTIQIISGILLLIYYVPDAEKAFKSVTYIMNNVPYGWFIRTSHAVGSNLMVMALMFHMLSVLFMGSYKSPRELTWVTGFILFTMIQGISLTGYLLPWSQLSYWATTVATNSANAIPLIGPYLVEFLRGGKLVGPPTLGRFFALHVVVIPAAIAGLIGVHLFLIKRTGISSPPFGQKETSNQWKTEEYKYEEHHDGIPFFPNYFLEDLRSILIYVAIFLAVVFFNPYFFFTPDSFLPANPMVTPAHIKPEWYFLANYQILKFFPNELIGLVVQAMAMTFLALIPFIDRGKEKHPMKRPIFMACFFGGILVWIGLTIWGHYS